MKLKLLLLIMVLGTGSGFAQDVITLINGLTITAKIKEVNDTSVKYKKFSNPNGPIYTLGKDKIGKIIYENGDIEYFEDKSESNSNQTPDQQQSVTNENIMQSPTQEDSYSSNNKTKTELNEYELLKIAETDNVNINFGSITSYKKKAKTYRLLGWIGGGAIFASGVITAAIFGYRDDDYGWSFPVIGAPLMGAGIVWGLSWNIAAHNMSKKAKLAEMYSMALLQTDEFKIGKTSIAGSLNLMGDTFTKSNALGFGLTIKL